MTFDDLGLSDAVRGAVSQAGYATPTPIQAQAIPHILQRRDVLGIAQTGTGKTAAFTLPMLTMLETGRARARMPRTLIVEPTRELAAQVEEAFIKYGVNHKLSVALLIGGVSFGDQDIKISRGADVLIATPGRLLDHVERGRLLLSGVELLVIDEADRMLDMGFIPDIERICKLVPFTRQTLFFTATMPPEIQRLTGAFLHNPIQIEVARPASTAATITQTLVATSAHSFEKRETLRRLMLAPNLKNAIIFCNRKRSVVELHRSLLRHEFSVAALHGDMDQPSRMRALDGFRQGLTKFLVASDVAARGLDIPAVSHIFNFDVPHHSEDYVHRIGRTGRAGLEGTAITLVTPEDKKSLDAIEKLIGQPIAWAEAPVAHGDASDVMSHGPAPRKPRPERSRAGAARRAAPVAPAAPAKPERHVAERHVAERHVSERHLASAPAKPERHAAPEHVPAPRPAHAVHAKARRTPHEEPAVLGLGDHVPSFLLRSVRSGA
ncbi:Superfamily II DNA and RNA helicase [Rhizobiales bacterium GAS191]|nr:Superfamily II DNA and RNA helicase [Rhizobiales bacterium GAS113]SEE18109.1 Superfamily II DNA and RNA helicase [Rhizobiales bacterium GAS191]